MNDEALLEIQWLDACREGDMEALARLVARHRGRLFRIAYGMLRNAEDAEDVVQEAFVRAYEALERFDRSRALAPWLAAIASRLALDRLRGRSRARKVFAERASDGLPEPVALAPDNAERDLQQRELREALNRAVESLDGKMRAVLILKDVEGFETEQVAEMLDIEAATVRVHLFKARARLREMLEHMRGGPRGDER